MAVFERRFVVFIVINIGKDESLLRPEFVFGFGFVWQQTSDLKFKLSIRKIRTWIVVQIFSKIFLDNLSDIAFVLWIVQKSILIDFANRFSIQGFQFIKEVISIFFDFLRWAFVLFVFHTPYMIPKRNKYVS